MFLYANGCSFTYGDELSSDQHYRIEHAWPNLLAKKLGTAGHHNDGKPGGSNDRIYRTTLEWIAEWELNGGDPGHLFVAIAWSHPSRREFHVDGRYVDMLFNHRQNFYPQYDELFDAYKLYALSLEHDRVKYAGHIIGLQSFLTCKKIPYVMCQALSVMDRGPSPKQEVFVDKNRFFNWNGSCLAGMLKNEQRKPHGHPNEDGHEMISNALYDFIMENGLLNV